MTNVMGEWSADDQIELMKVFYSSACEILENLQDALLKLETEPDSGDTLRTVKRYVHTLKGDSGSVGLTSIGDLCHRMEDVLSFFTDGDNRERREATDLLLSCIDALRVLLAKNEAGEDAGDAGAIRRIDGFLGQAALGPHASAAVVLSEYQELQSQEAKKSGLRVYEVEVAFHPECGEKGIAARMALQRLGSMGRIIHSVPDVENRAIDSAEKFTLVLAADRDAEDIARNAVLAGIIKDVRIRERVNADCGLRIVELKPKTETDSLRTSSSELRSEFLRIEASRVDQLMNLVGELIIGRSMVDQVAKELGSSGANDAAMRLRSINGYLERKISDLRKGVMKMRMVPVNQVFRKFPRMVRDLSVEKGKPVRIEIVGKETELDKGIVDNLGEPLAHIIRNMVDHGIETPDQRRSAGKPAEGVITVRAYHEAAQIVIEASDDGQGMDTKKLKQRAVEKGFLGPDEAAKMTDADAVRLVFLPGLSTAEIVTDTSGRGVGMDAVKNAVENMRGSVEIASTPRKGTLMRLRLPLTLAVIRALLFQAGEKLYAVPLSAVAEIVKVMTHDLTTVDGRDTLLLRERAISLIRMEKLFNAPQSEGSKQFALILSCNNRKVGLLVDRIAAQQDLVIKSLEGDISRSDMIAGASILGNGKVVIILDAPAVVRKAVEDEKKARAAA